LKLIVYFENKLVSRLWKTDEEVTTAQTKYTDCENSIIQKYNL